MQSRKRWRDRRFEYRVLLKLLWCWELLLLLLRRGLRRLVRCAFRRPILDELMASLGELRRVGRDDPPLIIDLL